MNEKTNPVFSLEDESTSVTLFSFRTKKNSVGNAVLRGHKSQNSYKQRSDLYGLKKPVIIIENVELSKHLRQVYSL